MKKIQNKKDNKGISIFDLNYDVIEDLNKINIANTFQGDKILGNLKNEPSYKDDSEVLLQSSSFKINKVKQNAFKLRNSVLLPEQNKLISLLNFRKEHDFIKNSKKRKENKNTTIKYITYEDTFLENEVFIPSPASYTGESFESNKLLNDFCEDYNCDNYNNDIMNNSFSFKTKKEDNNLYLKFFTKTKENEEDNINLDIKNNSDPLFVDEKEIEGKNILFLKGKKENLEINHYAKLKDKNNISNISLNLFIKKIAKNNLRNVYHLLYESFLEQFSIFLSTNILIEKTINAFNYYKEKESKEYPELVNLLNNIVSKKYKLFENDSNIIKKLSNFYHGIQNEPWLKDYLKQDTLSIDYILSNEKEEFDLNFVKYSISQRKKNIIFIKETLKDNSLNSHIPKDEQNSIKKMKDLYFYIFDYTEEEIAISLTHVSYNLLCNINIEELLNTNFSKKDKHIRAPNVMKVIEHFDKLVLFIIEDICSYDEPKRRAEAITKWIKIAEQCKNLYNFNDLLVINTCFSNYLMRRMVLTWKKVPKSTVKKMNELKKFCSNNQCYLNFRREMVNRRGRFYVPYLGILLKEIVNIEEKNKYVLDNGNINCLKIQKLYIAICQFFSFKNNPFAKIQLKALEIFGHLDPKTEDQIENIIAKIEPKLIITSGDNKKRRTKTDAKYYY
jgi:hypothetical protein